eukprot:TRINITY_DN57_c0_g1_i1.p1 TRINITY_DN57_c0_g1~~TRINITY_DN57_c0_g1_i1.p1  ORF type:complete len:321 (+),score=74.64 TRINITY_DN57_c0_g1_i1:54-1016(+)
MSAILQLLVPYQSIAISACAVIGGLFALKALLSFLQAVWTWVLAPGASWSKYRGQWAVITGASYGLGAGFAENLARKGINVALIARTPEKLDALVEKIKSKSKVEARSIKFDFSTTDEKQWAQLAATLKALNPAVLINNVGTNYEFPIPFEEAPSSLDDQLVAVNITATNRITKLVVPGMIQNKRGVVWFLGSGLSFLPSGLLAVYGGTKAYATSMAYSLHRELKKYGIIVQGITPSLVQSEMSKIRRATLTMPTADKYTRATLNQLGRSVVTAGYWVHALQFWALSLLPVWKQSDVIYGIHAGTRKRALAKKERETKTQ